ncbi:MAG: hypothetical protein GY795_20945 [Desulfobacterales bacterium]|nr:hypothetical protein [Desulfobacterales bacterium]
MKAHNKYLYGISVILMVVGITLIQAESTINQFVQSVFSTDNSKKTANNSSDLENKEPPTPLPDKYVQEIKYYYIEFDENNHQFVIQNSTNRKVAASLPKFIPNTGVDSFPKGLLDFEELREAVRDRLKKEDIPIIENEDAEELYNIRLNGKKSLFEMGALSDIITDKKNKDRLAAESPFEHPASLPYEPLFDRNNMLTRNVLKLLKIMKTDKETFIQEIECLTKGLSTVNLKTVKVNEGFSMILPSGCTVNGKQRVRIRKRKWMIKNIHHYGRICKMWLQLNIGAMADGQTGSGTTNLLKKKFAKAGLEVYKNLIRNEWSKEVPDGLSSPVQQANAKTNSDSTPEKSKGINPALNPLSEIFKRRMEDWQGHISELLKKPDKNSPNIINISYYPEGRNESVLLRISKNAVKRIKSQDFGEKNKDKAIYLQYLAIYNGNTLTIDGQIGPQTRSALKKMMKDKFNGTKEQADEYEKLLKNYF